MFLYHFNLFFKNIDIPVEGVAFLSLMQNFENKFVPSVINEISADGKSSNRVRMIGVGDMDGLTVTFGSMLVSVQHKSEILYDKDFPEIDEKIKFTLKSIFNVMRNQNSVRIATLISKIFETEAVYEADLINKFFGNGLGADAVEWNTRIVKNFNSHNELCNHIISVNRAQMIIPDLGINQPTDMIIIETDSNTVAENGFPRFNAESFSLLKELFNKSKDNLISVSI